MANYNSLYDVFPLSLYVLNEKNEIVYGKEPRQEDLSFKKVECTILDRHYAMMYSFPKSEAEIGNKIELLVDIMLSLTNKNEVKKNTYPISYAYTFLCNVLKNEVASNLSCRSENELDGASAIRIGDRGFLTVFSVLVRYLCKNADKPTVSYEDDFEQFKIILTSENFMGEFSEFLYDYCKAAAEVSGFSLCVEKNENTLIVNATIEKTAMASLIFSAFAEQDIVSLISVLFVL
jgi:hypothetical protein